MLKNLPTKVFRCGRTEAAIWMSDMNGRPYVQFSHRVGARFFKNSFRWQNVFEIGKLVPIVNAWISHTLSKSCEHDWKTLMRTNLRVCKKCRISERLPCEHEWKYYPNIIEPICSKCGDAQNL